MNNPLSLPVLLDHIGNVLLCGTLPDMEGVTARSLIARMANFESWIKRTFSEF